MVFFPPCKINLGLRIIEKRIDGFHNIETCFYPVPWTDILEIIPASSFSFTTSGLDVTGDPEHNLCVKAYRFLQQKFDFSPVKMHLHKIIPMGAGLGGGSSDAAYVLRGLNEMFELNIATSMLGALASSLGSDCSFFLHDEVMIGTEKGDVLHKADLSLKGKFLVLIKPEIHVSTQEAYAGIKPDKTGPVIREVIETKSIAGWKTTLKNDFEESIFIRYPELQAIKQKLYNNGALYASMSGSGSSVYGIFDAPADLKPLFSDVAYWAGELLY